MTPMSLAAPGPLSDAFGVQPWFIIAGLSMAVLGNLVPKSLNHEDQREREHGMRKRRAKTEIEYSW
jgi:type IV secretory pathway TrbD component